MTFSESIEQQATLELVPIHSFPLVERRTVLKQVPSGEIAVEAGSDGLYLRFDCDCLDALSICKAQCCALVGTIVAEFEIEANPTLPVELDNELKSWVMVRDSDGYCNCLNRETRTCNIYETRPTTCRAFHCTRGAEQRGWKLSNRVHRQSEI